MILRELTLWLRSTLFVLLSLSCLALPASAAPTAETAAPGTTQVAEADRGGVDSAAAPPADTTSTAPDIHKDKNVTPGDELRRRVLLMLYLRTMTGYRDNPDIGNAPR